MSIEECYMSHYVVCHKKRNNPRMDVRICEKKCPEKDLCTEYCAYHRVTLQEGKAVHSKESPGIELKAA